MPWGLVKVEDRCEILSSEHEIMVNNCLFFPEVVATLVAEAAANL
jgi:hypothetical protein